MISFKKSYAEQMLQLALALSLLQVDPRDYFNQGWDSQLEMRNGDGWQLEMLRAVPISEYPYANRKAMMPLIEDLVRFDRQNIQDVTTYLLNIQNAQTNHTSSLQDHGNSNSSSTNVSGGSSSSSSSNVGSGGIGVTSNTASGGGAIALEQPSLDNSLNSINEIDFFLNLNPYEDELSIIDQNLADLGEYDDTLQPTLSPYLGLPLKEEPHSSQDAEDFSSLYNQIRVKQEFSNTNGSTSSVSNDDFFNKLPSTSTNSSFRDPDSGTLTNSTQNNSNEENSNNDSSNDIKNIEIKKEKEDENSSKTNDDNISPLEFLDKTIKEESEIVEVLWKQDVDLGYSLTPPKNPIASTSSDCASQSKCSDDDIEKLKALEEIKLDKNKDDVDKPDLDDEWAGIPFRIDNETGEYIRQPSLQLDEILQDILQLADLTTDDQEESHEIKTDLKVNQNIEFQPQQIDFTSLDDSVDTTTTTTTTEKTNDKTNKIVDDCPAIVDSPQAEVEISSLPSPLFDIEDANELEASLDMMIQSATAGPFQHHHHRPVQNYVGPTNSAFRQSGFHHHHHHHQSRVPLSRGLSMEQRLQDIANLFNPLPGMSVGMGVGEMSPYPHYSSHYPYQAAPSIAQHGQFPHHTPHSVLHNATLTDQPHYGHNLGSAVSSSMHLTNSTHETDVGATGYKTDPDMMYYSNTSSELNHTTDGFINSILNDEDLQLMDMGVNESFCGMRMLENNSTSNTSSVLGSTSGTNHSSNHLITSTMPTSLGPLGNGGTTTTETGTLGTTAGDRLDASSDSAVSSMGSERVPSLSDGEWGDAGSDSAQEYHQRKYGGPYDYSYNSRLGDVARQHPVAQKKHQMYGKRYFQEQPSIPTGLTHPPSSTHQHPPADHIPAPSVKYEYEPYSLHHGPAFGHHNLEGAVGPIGGKDHLPLMSNGDMKYPCSLDFSVRPPRTAHDLINHNHTYTLPQATGSIPKPQIRDKKQKKVDDEHLTRDEKRARAMNIPITVSDIINLPMDEFNERLSKYDLTENQLSLIRDIRRRGKNKVAAQNCRKRKLDQILSLEDEVKDVRRRKEQLCSDHDMFTAERKRIANKFAALHRHVFQYLRDADGNPCSPSQYSLQQAADGSVYLLRRENKKPDGGNSVTNTQQSSLPPNTHNTTTSHNHHQPHHHQQQHHPHHSHVTQGPSTTNHHQKE